MTDKQQHHRLSVNINENTMQIIQSNKERGQSATETVRQALAYYQYFQDQRRSGKVIQVFDPVTGERRDVVFVL